MVNDGEDGTYDGINPLSATVSKDWWLICIGGEISDVQLRLSVLNGHRGLNAPLDHALLLAKQTPVKRP